MRYMLPFICVLILLSSCSSSIPVRTLPEGNGVFHISGGALVTPDDREISDMGYIPVVALGYYNGIFDGFTVGGEIYPLLILGGIGGANLGFVGRILSQDDLVPEITASAQSYFFFADEFVAFPSVRVNASWGNAPGTFFFAGIENSFVSPKPVVFVSPLIGVAHHSDNGRGAQIELKVAVVGDQDASDDIGLLTLTQIGIFVGAYF